MIWLLQLLSSSLLHHSKVPILTVRQGHWNVQRKAESDFLFCTISNDFTWSNGDDCRDPDTWLEEKISLTIFIPINGFLMISSNFKSSTQTIRFLQSLTSSSMRLCCSSWSTRTMYRSSYRQSKINWSRNLMKNGIALFVYRKIHTVNNNTHLLSLLIFWMSGDVQLHLLGYFTPPTLHRPRTSPQVLFHPDDCWMRYLCWPHLGSPILSRS